MLTATSHILPFERHEASASGVLVIGVAAGFMCPTSR